MQFDFSSLNPFEFFLVGLALIYFIVFGFIVGFMIVTARHRSRIAETIVKSGVPPGITAFSIDEFKKTIGKDAEGIFSQAERNGYDLFLWQSEADKSAGIFRVGIFHAKTAALLHQASITVKIDKASQ